MTPKSNQQGTLTGDGGVLNIYADGGARGNPGPAAIGAVIGDREYSDSIGEATNNVAEYSAVVFALQKAKDLLGKKRAKEADVRVHLDSELVVRQLNSEYKVRAEELRPLFVDVHNLTLDFAEVVFRHIPREENVRADALVNQALDGQ